MHFQPRTNANWEDWGETLPAREGFGVILAKSKDLAIVSKPTTRACHELEPAIEWFPDAGLPRRSLAKMGGITEISRWCQPPEGMENAASPDRGDGIVSRDFPLASLRA